MKTEIRYQSASHRAQVLKDNDLEFPSKIEILVWSDGIVQIGNADIGKYLEAEKLGIGEMAKANLGTYVVAIKRIAETPPVRQAKILQLPKTTKAKSRKLGTGKAKIIRLSDRTRC